jgi:hypothetical protein
LYKKFLLMPSARRWPVSARHDGTCPIKVASAVTASISTWMR